MLTNVCDTVFAHIHLVLIQNYIAAKAVTALLRKIERAAQKILLIISDFNKPANSTTQARMITILPELPKSKRSISLQEKNEIINDYEFYVSEIEEDLRVDLTYIHLALKKIVKKATEQEHRTAAPHLGIQDFLHGGALPQLFLGHASPRYHKYQGESCTTDLGRSLMQIRN